MQIDWEDERSIREFTASFEGSTEWLQNHLATVARCAHELATILNFHDRTLDGSLVMRGALVHDVGKVVHVDEQSKPGNDHEIAGRELLLEFGAPENLAQFCVSHAQPQAGSSVEEWVVANADKLWKGKRITAWELGLCQSITKKNAANDEWELMAALDEAFDRLSRMF